LAAFPVDTAALDGLGAGDYDFRMILLIDNYDSFTYNLLQRIGELELGRQMRVIRNDVMAPEQAEQEFAPTHLIISPGPGTPDDAGLSCDYIRHFHGKIPILGVCLGHQSIGQVFGGSIERAGRMMHGKTSEIRHDGKGVYRDLPNPFTATRYHSLTVNPDGLDEEFEMTAWSTDREELMGLRSKTNPTEGVQFHPESFLTEIGHTLLRNFLEA
jgi:anthranilate synthase/aminodeoxychorismate synthase-like glutamine amidotransferase